MSRRPIYVDMDDVLCETARGFLTLLERDFGRRVEFEDIRDFDLSVSLSLGPDELERFFERAHRPRQLAALAPIPGSLETVRAWKAAGQDVSVVTGRPAHTAASSRDWLAHHAVPHRELTFVDKYGRSGADGEEGVLGLDEMRPDRYLLAIEDSLATARFLAGRGIPVILLDRPWNQGACGAAVRCAGWDEVPGLAAELAGVPEGSAASSARPLPS